MSNTFYELNPNLVLHAVDQEGYRPTGYMTQLNSYENRVMSIEIEDGSAVIAKFYRPERWSKEALLDEHSFLIDLKKEGIPAVAPLPLKSGETLAEHSGIYMALFPKVLGRCPDEFLGDDLKSVGRRLAQIHNIGARKKAKHRPELTPEFFGWPALDLVSQWVTPELRNRYEAAAVTILEALEDWVETQTFIRIHGDCHRGNLLNSGKEFFFVDFDDFCNGPTVQDFWMLIAGDPDQIDRNVDMMLSGYTELRDFDETALDQIFLLRGQRLVHYSSWIAKRWEDPSFPRLFPEFNTYLYWLEETDALEKLAAEV